MARKVLVIINDDLSEDETTPADETIDFALDGVHYEIDLTQQHADMMRQELARYTEVARKITRGQRRPQNRRNRSSVGSSNASNKTAAPMTQTQQRTRAIEIREWARNNGHQLGDRGRIPNTIVQEFESAMG